MTPYVYLRFRDLKEFVEYLKQREIYCYGLVIQPEITKTRDKIGVQWITLSWRLSAKDSDEQEILVIDLLYHSDVYINIDHARKQSAAKEKEVLDFINKTFKELTPAGVQWQRLEAEWKVTEI